MGTRYDPIVLSSEEDSSATEDEGIDIHVSVLFLAHDGVLQAETWLRWQRALAKQNIIVHFGVVSNPHVRHNAWFSKHRRLPVNIRTGWCELSLVKAWVAGLQAITYLYKSDFVFFVSGADIPLANAEDIRQVIERGLSCVAMLEDGTEHTQWVHLTQADAVRVGQFTAWESLAYRDPDVSCFDEYVPYEIMKFLRLTFVNDALTDMERSTSDAPSPITWESWSVKQPVHRNDETYMMSLNDVLSEYIKDDQNFLFFRKVGIVMSGRMNRFVTKKYPWLSLIKKSRGA